MSSSAPVWRFSLEQKEQILALPEMEAALFSKAVFGKDKVNMVSLCRSVWTDEAKFKVACEALKMETLRTWLSNVSLLFSSIEEWKSLKIAAWGPASTTWDLYSIERTYKELDALRRVITERLEHAARVPLPEATRQTILCIKRELVEKQHYADLCDTYTRAFGNPSKCTHQIPDEWVGADFADHGALERFQTHVDRAERLLLHQKIEKAIYDYPTYKWVEFKQMILAHFGDHAREICWWKKEDVALEDLRFYLEMLGEHNLNKVKLMIEPTILNCVALFDCTATETKSKAVEPEVPTPVSAPKPLTLVERKICFLHQLRDKDHLWTSLASYMDLPESSCNLEGIARKVSLNDDETLLSKWEAIVNKTDPEHIFWKLLNHKIGEVERPILKGLADLPTNSDSRSVQQRILFFWSTYKQPKRDLICAYLDTLPKKKETKKQ